MEDALRVYTEFGDEKEQIKNISGAEAVVWGEYREGYHFFQGGRQLGRFVQFLSRKVSLSN